jgi:hypothetical protein
VAWRACARDDLSLGEFGERQPEFESLTTFLEEMADALEAPSLADPAKPGLVNRGLVWGPPVDPDLEALWVPFAG